MQTGKDKSTPQNNSHIFLHNNDCESPYIEIYIDLLSINFNLMSVLLYCAHHQISDYEIYTALTANMVAKYIVLSSIISLVADNILRVWVVPCVLYMLGVLACLTRSRVFYVLVCLACFRCSRAWRTCVLYELRVFTYLASFIKFCA